MVDDIIKTSARHVGEVRNISRDLTEKALHMRCLGYLANVKAKLLTETIFEIDESKKALLESKQKLLEQKEFITQQKHLLERHNKELAAFSHSVSHDLRAPLRHITGYSHILLEDYEDKLDDDGKQYLRRISDACLHMNELIDGMLQLSQLTQQSIHRQKVDLSAMVHSIITTLKETEPNRKVSITIAEDIQIKGDKKLLRIAMENLIGNAWKYTAEIPDAKIEFSHTKQNGEHVYFVRDNGIGFSMKHAEQLFAPFKRLHKDKKYEGLGIGLATVARIIDRHSGKIWAKADVDKGATFYFTLG